MSHADEQTQEVEALEAIYSDELEWISRDYPTICFQVNLNSQNDENEESSSDFSLSLQLSFPADYPSVIPGIEIEGLEEVFPQERIDKIISDLRAVAEENLEMPMAFTIISALQEQIGQLVDEMKTEKERAIEMKKWKEDEAQRKKFEGTRVNVESFLAWKDKFDTEMRALREKAVAAEQAALAGKLTGRQQFLRDATLSLSDIALIQEAEDNVQIDESLFEDMDELDIEESDED
uniref:RWD domain-containing protein n=1 Tax=Plectus sambesii TaxID=2011161 RepID=A0A914XJ77_9BILA